MVKVAIMGYGVVGSGVAELLDKNGGLFEKKLGQPIEVKYILDIRDFPGDRYAQKLIKDFETLVSDPEVCVVAETIGGVGKAYEFTRRCLEAGKSVVTSNKELVATHGPELLKLAKARDVNYLFEASVGGGIPVIHPMLNCLAANRINRIVGILNGTTNYILTKMIREHTPMADALKQAQRLGYAESDPSADVSGKDSCRKICILASLAFGKHVDPKLVTTVGIEALTLDDVAAADAAGRVIKLLGYAAQHADGDVEIFVSPCAIPKTHALANIEDVFNGILLDGDAVGEVTFYGRGAGKLPTASAVCSDIIDAVLLGKNGGLMWSDCGEDFVCSGDRLNFTVLAGTNIPLID